MVWYTLWMWRQWPGLEMVVCRCRCQFVSVLLIAVALAQWSRGNSGDVAALAMCCAISAQVWIKLTSDVSCQYKFGSNSWRRHPNTITNGVRTSTSKTTGNKTYNHRDRLLIIVSLSQWIQNLKGQQPTPTGFRPPPSSPSTELINVLSSKIYSNPSYHQHSILAVLDKGDFFRYFLYM